MIVRDGTETYPSWLEVTLSGRKTLVGRFVGHFGSARPISEVLFSGNKVRFSIPVQWEQRDDVMAFLERYRTAIEACDIDTLARLYLEFPQEQRAALVHYFKDTTNLRVKLEDIDVAIAGDEAIVSYTRRDDFVDAPTGRLMHVSGRVTKLLRRTEGRWQLAPGR